LNESVYRFKETRAGNPTTNLRRFTRKTRAGGGNQITNVQSEKGWFKCCIGVQRFKETRAEGEDSKRQGLEVATQ
jgi:hypothetical protein